MTRSGLAALAAATAIAVPGAAGCNLNKLAADQTIGVLALAEPSFEREDDIGLAEAGIFANLKLFEGLMEVSPKNRTVYYLSAQAFGSYAFGFLDPKIESMSDPTDPTRKVLVARAISFYTRGRTYAEKWMAFKVKDISAKLHGDLPTAKATLAALDKKMVPGLFWCGYNWAQLINAKVDVMDEPVAGGAAAAASDDGDVSATPPPAPAKGSGGGLVLAEFDSAKAVMERVAALDETFFNASPHTILGVMAGARPVSLGGDPKEAAMHFDKAIELTHHKFLLPIVFKAQFWATNVGDRAAFEALLKEALAAPDDLYPEQRLANELAKMRAAMLLKQADTLFVDAGK
jgi:hypothetical protein